MQNILGLLISFAYIFIVLGLVTLYAARRGGASETSRKLIHILVGNWVFITPMFTSLWALMVVPSCFVVINLISRKHKLFPAMEREGDGYGTVYYAVSMLVLPAAAFLLDWPTLSFVGLLIMAYGDGLAAIVGKRCGRRHPFPFAREKSLEGSLTLAAVSFVVTFIALIVLQGKGALRAASIPMALLIAALTAAFATFVELTGKAGCDNLSLPLCAGIFATLCLQFGDLGHLMFLLACLAILLVAFRQRVITPDGMVAALLTGQTLYALGGSWLGMALLAFFVLGSAVARLKNDTKTRAEQLQGPGGARNWKQVLANSLPASVLVWFVFVGGKPQLVLPALAVFAAATADTFASELGMLTASPVFSILGGKPIPRGLSGGISWLGLGAGITGSALLSLFAFPQFGMKGFVLCTLLGFAGAMIDSLLGALFQAKYASPDGELQEIPPFSGAAVTSGFALITNNAVNLLSLSLVAGLALLFV